MRLREPERGGAFARGVQRMHQPERYAAAVRVGRGAQPPPAHGVRRPLVALGGIGRRFHDAGVEPRHAVALLLGPPLELGRVPHHESIQQRPAVERGDAFRVARLGGGFQLQRVAADPLQRQPDLVADRPQRVLSQFLAEHVQRLGKQPARGVARVAAPQQPDDPLARDGAAAPQREDREHRESPRMGRTTADGAVRLFEDDTAEQVERVHRKRSREVVGGGKHQPRTATSKRPGAGAQGDGGPHCYRFS